LRDVFENLGRTIRSMLDQDRSEWDPDMKDAWSEINSYLNEFGEFDQGQQSAGDNSRSGTYQSQSNYYGSRDQTNRQGSFNSQTLAKDYANLELAPGATAEQVKSAYKAMLRIYHPDRHAGDQEKQRIATEITSRLNRSYQRIMDHLGA
jgi:curved DNA-binding protein CbpA